MQNSMQPTTSVEQISWLPQAPSPEKAASPKPEQTTRRKIVRRTTVPLRDKEAREKVKEALLKSSKFPDIARRNYLIWITGCCTGRRVNDLLSLTLGDVFNFSTQTIKREVTIIESKTGKVSTFGFSRSVSEAMYDYIMAIPAAERKPERPLFLSRKKVALVPRSYSNILTSINKQIKVCDTLGGRTMRKTYGITTLEYFNEHQAEYGFSGIEVLQMAFNHSSSRMTLNYLGITKDVMSKTYQIER